MAKKNGVKAKVAKKVKEPKSPYRVLLGYKSKNGKKYNFERHALNAADEAMAVAQKALDKGSDDLREVLIIVNPDAEVK